MVLTKSIYLNRVNKLVDHHYKNRIYYGRSDNCCLDSNLIIRNS